MAVPFLASRKLFLTSDMLQRGSHMLSVERKIRNIMKETKEERTFRNRVKE
jgi:hypothetical protein